MKVATFAIFFQINEFFLHVLLFPIKKIMSGVVRECQQGVMGHKVAEERLRESQKEFAYLTREFAIKRGRFIVSNLTKTGSVKHTVVPNSSTKKNYANLEARPGPGRVMRPPIDMIIVICFLL